MTDVEKGMARQVAEALGDENISQTMRRLLREKYIALFGALPKPKRARGKN